MQVQVGGRGKGGGVVLVDSPERAAEEAARMLGSDKGHEVRQVLVEELLPIAREFYTSMLLDRSTGDYLAMMTAEGSMDIEELARTRPEALRRAMSTRCWGCGRSTCASWSARCRPTHARSLRRAAAHVRAAAGARRHARRGEPARAARRRSVVALDSKVTVDDNALFRHPDVEAYKDAFPIDPVQARANEQGLQYVKLDGNVGIIGNGAGS